MGVEWNPKTGFLEKSPKNVKYLKNVHLQYMEFKPGRNKLFQGENGPGKCDMWLDVNHVSHV